MSGRERVSPVDGWCHPAMTLAGQVQLSRGAGLAVGRLPDDAGRDLFGPFSFFDRHLLRSAGGESTDVDNRTGEKEGGQQHDGANRAPR